MKLHRASKSDSFILLGAGILLVLFTGYLFINPQASEWKQYQNQFQSIIDEEFGPEAAASIPVGIQQIWVEKIDLIDRCTTCHQGITWRGLETLSNPYKTHPQLELFSNHPLEKYGCTTCHSGQGYALTSDAAHGYVSHWEDPMYSKAIAEEYLIRDPSALIEINCNVCHRYERETEGMPFVNHAKKISRDKVCKACHIINGSGGTIGPDLTKEGDKHAENLDFSNFAGFQSAFNWHVTHFKNPLVVVPNTIMPDLNFSTYDAQSLAILAMSWQDREFPVDYITNFKREEDRTPEEIEREEKMLSGDGAFFIEKGCFVCHSISSWDIISPSEKGPDLAYAVDDVRIRFGKTLDEFMFEPSGTMKIILSTMIILNDQERWDVVDMLRKAYNLKQKQLAEQNK